MNDKPAFLITIDAEGDNLWAGPETITTENARFLPRFQELCERRGMRPAYLTNYEMAMDSAFQEFAKDALEKDAAEIGMHLHAWNSPPVDHALSDSDYRSVPYLTSYPRAVMRDKIHYLHDLLEETFQTKMVSHRAGRWGFDNAYAQEIAALGYLVDCSVTPYVSWAYMPGGPDYRSFPDRAYFLDLEDISKEGDSGVLELPMTILPAPFLKTAGLFLDSNAKAAALLNRFTRWVRPRGNKKNESVKAYKAALSGGADYIEFMIHSSELMPGGSPYFPDERSVEKLYEELEELFELAAATAAPMTLKDYGATFK